MVRGSKFDSSEFVEAALVLLCEGGPSAVTMQAIARRSGAPTGSIYHRFPSRSAVVAAAWLAALTDFADHVEGALAFDPAEAAPALVAWARSSPRQASALFLNEPASLFDTAPPDALQAEIRAQEVRIDGAFDARVQAGPGRDEGFARLRFALVDGPIALIRPYLQSGAPIPEFVDALAADLGRSIGRAASGPAVQAAE